MHPSYCLSRHWDCEHYCFGPASTSQQNNLTNPCGRAPAAAQAPWEYVQPLSHSDDVMRHMASGALRRALLSRACSNTHALKSDCHRCSRPPGGGDGGGCGDGGVVMMCAGWRGVVRCVWWWWGGGGGEGRGGGRGGDAGGEMLTIPARPLVPYALVMNGVLASVLRCYICPLLTCWSIWSASSCPGSLWKLLKMLYALASPCLRLPRLP
jgi:hypothetical protein